MSSNPFAEYATAEATRAYHAVRPDYPLAAVKAVLTAGPHPPKNLADIGSGTGIFARQATAIQPTLSVQAIEPSAAMRAEQRVSHQIDVHDATSENTGLPDKSVDLVVWAQSFHWIEPEASAIETRRILRPGGVGVVVANQMDVSVPWVHRLTRIMRSGDVHRVNRPPRLPGFITSDVQVFPWTQHLTTHQVMELARTRSSYLTASEERQQKMQQNLDWYLHEYLAHESAAQVDIPYAALVWVLTPDPDPGS